jgi:hypothetical protein
MYRQGVLGQAAETTNLHHRDTEAQSKETGEKLNDAEFTSNAEGNANFHGYVSTSLCCSVTLWQTFLPLRGCQEFPIIAGAC